MGSGPGIACSFSLNTVLTDEQRERYQDTASIAHILDSTKTIVLVGLSTDPQKASNMVASYLQDEGYRIIPVNPSADVILGEKCYRSLSEIEAPVDLVNIFRPSHEIPALIDQAIAMKAKAVWLQLRIVNFPAADKAIASGIPVVVDKCIKMEHGRYSGGLQSLGMNTEIISARRRKR
jgi:predicted CoA-binding protein